MTVHYDVVLSSGQHYFASRFRELCGQFNLSFFLAEPIWVSDLLRKVQEGEIKIHVLIDMASDAYEANNLYFELAKEVKKSGAHVVDDPAVGAVCAHKGLFHTMLLENNIGVPESVIIPRSEISDFRLTDEIKGRLGVPFVVKPGWGGGGLGVNISAYTESDLARCAELAPDSDSFLIQKRIKPKILEGHIGWFRVFHVFDETIPCWWEPPANQYQIITPLQRQIYKLGALARISRNIAKVSKMKFFSTEICLTEEGKFLAVDYLNTDCDMSPKSFFPTGVPDEVVRHIAWLMVEYAMNRVKRGHGFFDEDLAIKDEDWGDRRRRGMLVPGE